MLLKHYTLPLTKITVIQSGVLFYVELTLSVFVSVMLCNTLYIVLCHQNCVLFQEDYVRDTRSCVKGTVYHDYKIEASPSFVTLLTYISVCSTSNAMIFLYKPLYCTAIQPCQHLVNNYNNICTFHSYLHLLTAIVIVLHNTPPDNTMRGNQSKVKATHHNGDKITSQQTR